MDEDTNVSTDTTGSESETTDTTADVNKGSADEAASESSDGKQTAGKPANYDRRLSKFKEQRNEARIEAEKLRTKISELEKKSSEGNAQTQSAVSPQVAALKEQIKQLGFVDRSEIEADLKKQQEDVQVQTELIRLEGKYDGSDGTPKFNRIKVMQFALDNQIGTLESAYRLLNEKKLTDWAIKQASTKTKGVKTEASTGAGSREAGTSDEDLTKAATKGDKAALHTFLKRRMREASKRK